MDFIFGYKDSGWLKTALASGLIGILILGLFRVDTDAYYEENGGKWGYILLGYPVWWILRKVYWNYRSESIRELQGKLIIENFIIKKDHNYEKYKKSLDSIENNNPELFNILRKF